MNPQSVIEGRCHGTAVGMFFMKQSMDDYSDTVLSVHYHQHHAVHNDMLTPI
jgi:hypothetical protein